MSCTAVTLYYNLNGARRLRESRRARAVSELDGRADTATAEWLRLPLNPRGRQNERHAFRCVGVARWTGRCACGVGSNRDLRRWRCRSGSSRHLPGRVTVSDGVGGGYIAGSVSPPAADWLSIFGGVNALADIGTLGQAGLRSGSGRRTGSPSRCCAGGRPSAMSTRW